MRRRGRGPARGVALAAACAFAVAPLPARGAFERPPLSPESEAMGGVLAVGPDGVWGNPAGPVLPFTERGLLAETGLGRPFDLADLTEGQAAASARLGRGGVGAGVRRFGSRDYVERELRLVLRTSPVPSVAVGGALRGLAVAGGPDAVRSFALDLAFRARPDPATAVGALAEGVLGQVPGDPRGEGRRTAFGVARRLGPRAVLRVELQRQGTGPLAAALGFDWTPWAPLTLRAGAREDPRTLSWGLSVRQGALSVSGSAAHTALGRTVRVGIRYAR